MDHTTASTLAQVGIEDLFKVILVDGLKAVSEGRELRYKVVRLRETGVAEERIAVRLAERVVEHRGVPRLLVSDAEFKLALNVQHIEAFVCDSYTIPAAAIDLDMIGKLSTHDLGLIEQRIALVTLAAEVRYGNITEEQFHAIVAGKPAEGVEQAAQSPQPVGQAAGVGAAAASLESGPALLADFVGDGAPVASSIP
ncbi:hypothetical protein [Variovorax sp. E3]|uniref:hypothetical protein n=1 Tax=Variovorax sp. E3 TaxID=1914993 RepID=UPI0018DB2EAC|nr:hypothetical protein [Variovorax sp. E3]